MNQAIKKQALDAVPELSHLDGAVLLTMVNASPDCVKMIDLDGKLAYMSPNGMCAMEVDDFQMIANKPWYSLWPTESSGLIVDSVQNARKGQTSRFHAFCPTAKGTPRWWDVSVSPVYGADGEVEKILSVSRDITALTEQTELRATQEKLLATIHDLERHADNLQRSNADLKQFAYVASHELASPLTSISGYASLLERRAGPSMKDQHREFLGFIADGAKRMQVLTRDLLNHATFSHEALQLAAVNIEPICRDLYSEIAADHPRATAFEIAENIPMLWADKDLLELVLRNLLSNAYKYNESECPRVSIHTQDAATPQQMQLVISDNGIGIPDEYHDEVFLQFKRLHGRTQYPGSGLGLATVKRMVERHGGDVSVAQNPSGGSIFTVTLPKAEQ